MILRPKLVDTGVASVDAVTPLIFGTVMICEPWIAQAAITMSFGSVVVAVGPAVAAVPVELVLTTDTSLTIGVHSSMSTPGVDAVGKWIVIVSPTTSVPTSCDVDAMVAHGSAFAFTASMFHVLPLLSVTDETLWNVPTIAVSVLPAAGAKPDGMVTTYAVVFADAADDRMFFT